LLMRPSTITEVEEKILNWILNGLEGIDELATSMQAGLLPDGTPVDPVANKRFMKGALNVKKQIQRLHSQRLKKMGDEK
jgi:hypothetical protein